MAGTAPFIAQPTRRLAAGAIDFVLSMMLAGFLAWIIDATGYATSQMRLAPAVYAAYHAGFFVLWDGQTPGLRTFDIRAVSRTGGMALSSTQIAVRSALRPVVLYCLGWFANGMMFPFNVVAVIILAPLLAELGMMFTLPTRQTLSDLVSRTVVVNVPPPQPHRAPAAPMYSPTDAEFGVRPKRVR